MTMMTKTAAMTTAMNRQENEIHLTPWYFIGAHGINVMLAVVELLLVCLAPHCMHENRTRSQTEIDFLSTYSNRSFFVCVYSSSFSYFAHWAKKSWLCTFNVILLLLVVDRVSTHVLYTVCCCCCIATTTHNIMYVLQFKLDFCVGMRSCCCWCCYRCYCSCTLNLIYDYGAQTAARDVLYSFYFA